MQIRPTMHFLIKGGVPTYHMLGIHVRTESPTISGRCNLTPPTPRILLLLAQQWITFPILADPLARVLLYYGVADGTDERLLFIDHDQIRYHVEQLGLILSQQQDQQQLDENYHNGNNNTCEYRKDTPAFSNGFHLILFVLNDDWIYIPFHDYDTATPTNNEDHYDVDDLIPKTYKRAHLWLPNPSAALVETKICCSRCRNNFPPLLINFLTSSFFKLFLLSRPGGVAAE
jgi:hypothetical protein